MQNLKVYIINPYTSSILPTYDAFANLKSIVSEKGKLFLVNKSPIKIIEHSLLNYASSLQGARDGSRHLIGNTHMSPIMISEKLGIYWFPTKSFSRPDCVWISLGQYKDYDPINQNSLKVNFKNCRSILIDSTIKSFETKLNNAIKLKHKMNEDPVNRGGNHEELNEILIIRDPEGNGYRVLDEADGDDEEKLIIE